MSFSPTELEHIENLRRITERGIKMAQCHGDETYVDLFQHMLDTIEQLLVEYE